MFEDIFKKFYKPFINKKNSKKLYIYDELIRKASEMFTDKEVLLIKKAYLMAKDLHRGQKRNSGEPYIIHPVYVAYILLEEMNLHDANTIAAALLHDTVEDCGITYEYLLQHFGFDVANLVMGVTKMKEIDVSSKEEKEDFNNYLLLKHILKDYRVILIKLADRLHNMRTLDYKNEAKRREKSAETLRIFVPLATHVGATFIRDELVDTSFKYLSNSSYREIKGMSKYYLIKHQAIIEDMLVTLRNLSSSLNINSEIRPRIMNNFAIYQKLVENKKISLLPNLLSYHIMVEKKEDIYQFIKKIEEEFNVNYEYTQDFITKPLNNGYQAYHLSIRGHKGTPFQIRLFTKEMFLVNNYGFSALIELYPNKSIKEIQEELIRNNEFFHSLDQNYKLYKKPFEVINKSVRELLADKINVRVANGAIYCLPAMSTVADLALKIHTELYSNAIGAEVNGTLVDLNFPLKENDHVVILLKEKITTVKKEANELSLSLKKEIGQ